MWIDGANGVAQHIAQNIDFAVALQLNPGIATVYFQSFSGIQLHNR